MTEDIDKGQLADARTSLEARLRAMHAIVAIGPRNNVDVRRSGSTDATPRFSARTPIHSPNGKPPSTCTPRSKCFTLRKDP